MEKFKKMASSSESFLKEQVDKLLKENKILKHRIELAERESQSLKKSLYDISLKYNLALNQSGVHLNSIFLVYKDEIESTSEGSNEVYELGNSPVDDSFLAKVKRSFEQGENI